MVGFTRKFSVSLMNYVNDTNEPLQVIKLYDFELIQHHQLWPENMDTFINYALKELLAYPLIDDDIFRVLEVFRFLRDTFALIMIVNLDETINTLIGNHHIPSDTFPVNQENVTYIIQTQEMITNFFQLETQNIAFVFTFEDSWMFNDDNRLEKVILKYNESSAVLEQVMQQYGILGNGNNNEILNNEILNNEILNNV